MNNGKEWYVIYGKEFEGIKPALKLPSRKKTEPRKETEGGPESASEDETTKGEYYSASKDANAEMEELEIISRDQKQLAKLLNGINRLMHIVEKNEMKDSVKVYEEIDEGKLAHCYEALKEENKDFSEIRKVDVYKFEGVSSLFKEVKSTKEANNKAAIVSAFPSSEAWFKKCCSLIETSHIALSCGHKVLRDAICEKIKEKRSDLPKGAQQFFCLEEGCAYVLNDNEMINILGSEYIEALTNYDPDTYLKDEKKFYCIFCADKFDLGRIIMIHSANHTFCIRCLKRYLNGARGDLIKCPVRSCTFECSRKYLMEEGRRVTDEGYELDLGRKVKCITCTQTFTMDMAVGLKKCKHYFCTDCFRKEIDTIFDNTRGIASCVCPIKDCGVQIGPEIIDSVYNPQSNSGETMAYLLEMQTLRKSLAIVECPKCHEEFFIPETIICKNLTCECDETFCRLCTSKPHKGICSTRADSIKMAMKLNEKIGPCPYCLELYAKDNRCASVSCRVTGEKYCFICSAKWSPIVEHGNHYHRKECRDYRKFEGSTKYSEKCDECKKTKQRLGKEPAVACLQPKELKNGDIPEEEFPDEFKT